MLNVDGSVSMEQKPHCRYRIWPQQEQKLQEWLTTAFSTAPCDDALDTAVMLISGPSGSGKSSLCSAVVASSSLHLRPGSVIRCKLTSTARSWQDTVIQAVLQHALRPANSHDEWITQGGCSQIESVNSKHNYYLQLRQALRNSLAADDYDALLPCIPCLRQLEVDFEQNETPLYTTRTTSDSTSRILRQHPDRHFQPTDSDAFREAFAKLVQVLGMFLQDKSYSSCEAVCGDPQRANTILIILDDLELPGCLDQDWLRVLTTAGHFRVVAIATTVRDFTIRGAEPTGFLDCAHLVLRDLTREDLTTFVNAEVFSGGDDNPPAEQQQQKALLATIWDVTQGNVYYATECARALNTANSDSAVDVLRGGVTNLIEARVKSIDIRMRQALALAALLGFDCIDLGVVYESLEIETDLSRVIQLGLVDQAPNGSPEFSHERVRWACRQTIGAQFYQDTGRHLWKRWTKEGKVEAHCVLLAQILQEGIELITEPGERTETAKLFHLSGTKLFRASLFEEAAAVLETSRRLLVPRHWRDQYQLSLDVYTASAEVEQIMGNTAKVEELAASVIDNGRSLADQLPAYQVLILAQTHETRFQESLNLGLSVLAKLGQSFPRKPNALFCYLLFRRVNRRLRKYNANDILRLPLMTDRHAVATMQILYLVFPSAFTLRSEYAPLLSMLMIELTLNHGLSALSAAGFGIFATLTTVVTAKFDDAYVYAKLALRLMDRFRVQAWMPMVSVTVYGIVLPTVAPVRQSIAPLMQAYKCGMQSGKTSEASFCLISAQIMRFLTSEEIGALYSEVVNLEETFKDSFVRLHLKTYLQTLENLLGRSDDPLILTGTHMNEQDIEPLFRAEKHLLPLFLFFKMTLAFVMNDYLAVERYFVEYLCLGERLVEPYSNCCYRFLGGAASLILACQSRRLKMKRTRRGRRSLRYLRKQAMRCPENHMFKVYFLEAQVCFHENKVDHGMVKLECAAEWAKQHGSWSEAAICAEHMGTTLCRIGRMEEGIQHLLVARSYYEKWGATAKVIGMKDAS